MKIETILFDLDDTLLGNDMDRFIPRYFALLGEYARPIFDDSGRLLQELLVGTQAMIANADPALTNREVFWQLFTERTGLEREKTEAFFDHFYESTFAELEGVTERREVAAPLVRSCLDQGLQVAVATNPLFPRRAIEHRLAWAGVPVADYDFALVTDYETMHAAKPSPAYYREIMERIGAEAESSLMVGDDWENDIEPATAVGMAAYWIVADDAVPPDPGMILGYGTLEDFHDWWHALDRTVT